MVKGPGKAFAGIQTDPGGGSQMRLSIHLGVTGNRNKTLKIWEIWPISEK
jgi:hypothetical protein